MSYQAEYHRCTLEHDNTAVLESILFYFIPMVTLTILYSVMIAKVIYHQIKCKKLLLTSVAIGATGVLVAIPQTLLYLKVHMGYKAAQFFTVTLFYISPLCDSVLYYYTNPRVRAKLPSSRVGRAATWLSEEISMGLTRNTVHLPAQPES